MLYYRGLLKTLFICTVILSFNLRSAVSQQLLARKISVNARSLPLENVLDRIGQKCGFSFSYNSNIIPRDSLVTVAANNETIKEVLDRLLGDRFEYKETAGYIILRYAPLRLALVTNKVESNKGVYHISGYVVDERTGSGIAHASVYERRLLRSALTEPDGSFDLKINTRNNALALTVSKELYRDTTVLILSAMKIGGAEGGDDDYHSDDGESVARKTALGRLFVSYKQKIQELNVPGFLAQSPVQASITPGLSSHGMLSGQVMNHFSFNVFGGYTAGVEGIEVGGLFNINKKHVKGSQTAGLFNLVGKSVTGVQVGGISNMVLDSVFGVQVGGISNLVRGSFSGVQVGGIVNGVYNSADGVQVAGIANLNRGSTIGLQVAGILNTSFKETRGMQIAGVANFAGGNAKAFQLGILNVAGKLKGFQLGLVNIADTSAGASLGLINLVRKNGVHTISVFADELQNKNLAIRTGTHSFYTIVQGAESTLGFGIGREHQLGSKFYLSPELLSFYVYQGSTDYINALQKVNLKLSYRFNKYISAFAAPSFNVFYSDQQDVIEGYQLITDKVNDFKLFGNEKLRGWAGWSFGISLF